LAFVGLHGWLGIHEPNGHLYIGRLSIYVWFDYIAGKQGINKPPREGPVLTPAMSRQAPTGRGLGRWADANLVGLDGESSFHPISVRVYRI